MLLDKVLGLSRDFLGCRGRLGSYEWASRRVELRHHVSTGLYEVDASVPLVGWNINCMPVFLKGRFCS